MEYIHIQKQDALQPIRLTYLSFYFLGSIKSEGQGLDPNDPTPTADIEKKGLGEKAGFCWLWIRRELLGLVVDCHAGRTAQRAPDGALDGGS